MTSIRSESTPIGRGQQASQDNFARDLLRKLMQDLGDSLVSAPGPMVELRDRNNAVLLLSGEHSGLKIEKQGTRILAMPGTVATRKVVITADCRIDGLRFASKAGSNNVSSALLDVSNNATVFLHNCVFERSGDEIADWIATANGCKLHLIGCTFTGQMVAGTCINNAGGVGDVAVWGSNKTGRPLGAVTSIFVTT